MTCADGESAVEKQEKSLLWNEDKSKKTLTTKIAANN